MAKYKEKADETRKGNEAAEGFETSKDVNAPKSRWQQDQQEVPAESARATKVEPNSYVKKEVKPSGSQLKQEVASKAIVQGTSGASSIETASSGSVSRVPSARTMTYSGTDGTILGSPSGTPIVGRADRADSRFGKRMDATNKKINYLVSEQVVVEYDQPKPLADNQSTQGYPGTPKNSSVRMQKVSGATPGDLLFDRSIDEITRDELFFEDGQYVKTVGVDLLDSPTLTLDLATDPKGKTTKAFSATKGNYVPRELVVKFGTNSSGGAIVTEFTPICDNITPDAQPSKISSAASVAAIANMNAAEIDRQAIDSKAGDETKDNWSPLGRAVQQPSMTVGYLRDLELDTGSQIYLAYRFGTKALSYQLNKAAKDGQDITGPMNEMLLGLIASHIHSSDFGASGKYNDPFSHKLESYGAASLMIDLFDSNKKYNNKADVLTQPRSLKMHLQTADNNINIFRLRPEFVAAVNARDVFSTIDRGYDPMGPVYMTDCVKAASPYDWGILFSHHYANGARVWDSDLFAYSYKQRMSRYIIKATHPLLAGISYFFDLYADKILNDLGIHELHIPIVHSTRCLSLWDYLVCAAVPYIQYERTNALKDVLDYEENFEYPFHQLKDIGSMNPLAATNYTIKGRDEPLECHEMLPSTALSWIVPELYVRLSATKTLAPWYFNEGAFEFKENNKTVLSTESGSMSYPVTRAGVRSAMLDNVYGMDERDLRLCLDRQVVPAGYSSSGNNYTVFKKSQAAEGQIIVNHSSNAQPTAIQYLKTPRELGWFMVAPAGFCQGARVVKSDEYKIETQYSASAVYPNIYFKEGTYAKCTDTSYRVRCWSNSSMSNMSGDSLDPKDVGLSRASSFIQKWDERIAADFASYKDAAGYQTLVDANVENGLFNKVFMSERDIFSGSGNNQLSASSNGAYLKVETTGMEDENVGGEETTNFKLIDASLLYYNRIQKLCFVLNPFDSYQVGLTDPFSFATLLNLAGFMESDFNEDLYNRISEVQNKGYLFTKDPFVLDSPLFKDAARLTEI